MLMMSSLDTGFWKVLTRTIFFAFVLSFKMRNEAKNDREQMLANIFSFL